MFFFPSTLGAIVDVHFSLRHEYYLAFLFDRYDGTWEEDKYHGKGTFTNSMDNTMYVEYIHVVPCVE